MTANLSATSHIITLNNLSWHVQDWGGGAKPPLWFVHGLASTCHMFDLIAPALLDHYHVWAFDQRGHGLSAKPDSGYDFATIAQDLQQVAAACGYADTPLTVVGHSWGAYTALYYAATRPATTQQVVLLDGGLRPLQDLFPTWAQGEIGLAPPLYKDLNRDGLAHLIRRWQGEGFRPEIEPLAQSIFDLSNPNAITAHLNRANNMQIAYHLWAFQPADYFPLVQCPLLVVNALETGKTADAGLLRHAQAAQQNPLVQVIWMANTIHDIPWHRPAELTAHLRAFLRP